MFISFHLVNWCNIAVYCQIAHKICIHVSAGIQVPATNREWI